MENGNFSVLSQCNVQDIFHVNAYNSPEELHEVNIIFIPILHFKKLKPR